MANKYDKFIFTYAVAKRAKEMQEEGIFYLNEEDRKKNPILNAINEINGGIVEVKVTENKNLEIKEEEDTLDVLYDDMKLPEHEILTKTISPAFTKVKKIKDIFEEDDTEEESLAEMDKETALDSIATEDDEEEEDEEELDDDDEVIEDVDKDIAEVV